MSRWTHAVCDDCWHILAPGRAPARVAGEAKQEELCCYCFQFTASGIYRRDDPSAIPCRGNHEVDA